MTYRSIPPALFILWFAANSYATVGWVIHPDENIAGLDWRSPQHPDIQLVHENYQVTIVKPDLSAKVTETLVFRNYGEAQQVEMYMNISDDIGGLIDDLKVYIDGRPVVVIRWYAQYYLTNIDLQANSSDAITKMLAPEDSIVYSFRYGELVCHKLLSYEPYADDAEFCPAEGGGYIADTWILEMPAKSEITVECHYQLNMHNGPGNITELPLAVSSGWKDLVEHWQAVISKSPDVRMADILYYSWKEFSPSLSDIIINNELHCISLSVEELSSSWSNGFRRITLYGLYSPLYSHPFLEASMDSPVIFLYDLNEHFPQDFKLPQLTYTSYVEALDVKGDWLKVKLLGVGAEWDQIGRIGWIEWRGYLNCSSVPTLQVIDAEPQPFYLDEKCSQLCPHKSQIYAGEWIYLLGRIDTDTCQVLVGNGEGAPGWNNLSSAEELYLGYIRFWERDKDDKIKMDFVLK